MAEVKGKQDRRGNSLQRRVLAIALAASLLLAAGGWGYAITLHTTSTPRMDPGALETINSNQQAGGSELLAALERRASVPRGGFTGKDISEDALLLLGWAATGKNREGTGFTVPLAMGAEPYVSLYLAQSSGVRLYDWRSNSFKDVTDSDIRSEVDSGQNASAVWIYVIDTSKLPSGNMNYAWHTIGAMSEHQYLVADSLNIGSRFMASIDAGKAAPLLGLDTSKNIPAGVMAMAAK